MVLLSVRAGLRAKEIVCLKWGMVADAEGQVGDALHLDNKSSKGRNGGRTIPLHAELRTALVGAQGDPHGGCQRSRRLQRAHDRNEPYGRSSLVPPPPRGAGLRRGLIALRPT